MNEMMTWVSPKSAVQRFEANDSISACLNATCTLMANSANQWCMSHIGGWVGPIPIIGHNTPTYTEPDTGLVHRECMCGSGAAFDPDSNDPNGMKEYNNSAYITEFWVDKTDETRDDGSIYETVVYKDGVSYVEEVFNGVTGALNAWWTTLYTGFGQNDTYTHTGYVTYDGNSPNHSN